MVKQSKKGKPAASAKVSTGAKTTAKKGQATKAAKAPAARVGAALNPAVPSAAATLSPSKGGGAEWLPSSSKALTKAELREAALHLLELAACRERAVAEDDDADSVLAIVCGKLLAHRRRRSEGFEEAASVAIAEEVAEVYRAVQAKPKAQGKPEAEPEAEPKPLTTAEAEARITEVFAAFGLALTDDGKAALDFDAQEIRDELGAVAAAKRAVGTVFGRSPRTMFYRESRHRTAQLPHRLDDPRLVQATAFGVRLGRHGLARYALALMPVPDDLSARLVESWIAGS